MNEKIGDISIAGVGKVSGGRYRNVSISGAGKVNGDIECEDINVSGSAKIIGNIKCKSIEIAGVTKIDGDLFGENINIAGYVPLNGNLKGNKIIITGVVKKVQNCECDEFISSGGFEIKESINADKINIEIQGKCRANEIVGEEIKVTFSEEKGFGAFLNSIFTERVTLCVDLIEADNIHLEHTIAKVVRGKDISIGEKCDIQVIEYSGELNVNENSKVSEIIKL